MLITVMLVDDNSTFLNIATRFLQEHDDVVVVSTATGGKEALAKAQDLHPQVILLDLAMPDLPGLKAIPRLRAEVPEARIIALTMLDTDSYREAALRAGAEEFVAKATMSTDLVPAILRVMQAHPTWETPTSFRSTSSSLRGEEGTNEGGREHLRKTSRRRKSNY